ncbi:MAG: hypothetical protein M1819_005855 [Sarea resinae]|nr:MAG: hypothetical protein M1819_005855 [Sarea resinae]
MGIGPACPLPIPEGHASADAYVDSLLHFATTSRLFQTLCGGVHILDFFTREPYLYEQILPEEWRQWSQDRDIHDILDLLMREDLGQFDGCDGRGAAEGSRLWRGGPPPPQSLLQYIHDVRRHLLARDFTPPPPPDGAKKRSSMPRHIAVGMKPKKIHEVENFALYVDRLATKIGQQRGGKGKEITHLVDFGSGQNYLGRALASAPYNRNIIAVESKQGNIEGARIYDVSAKLATRKKVMRNKKEYRMGEDGKTREGKIRGGDVNGECKTCAAAVQSIDSSSDLLHSPGKPASPNTGCESCAAVKCTDSSSDLSYPTSRTPPPVTRCESCAAAAKFTEGSSDVSYSPGEPAPPNTGCESCAAPASSALEEHLSTGIPDSTVDSQSTPIASITPSHLISTDMSSTNLKDTVSFSSEDGGKSKGTIHYISHSIQNGDLTPVLAQLPKPRQQNQVDTEDGQAQAPNSSTSNEPAEPNDELNLLTISLHSCGNLLHHGLRSLTLNPSVKAVALIGCCYNLTTSRLSPPTYKHPSLDPSKQNATTSANGRPPYDSAHPLRTPHPRLERTSHECDPHGFPMSERFATYPLPLTSTEDNESPRDQEDADGESGAKTDGERGIHLNITARMMAVQAPPNWTRVESEAFFTRHFYRAVLQRMFLDRGVISSEPLSTADDNSRNEKSNEKSSIDTTSSLAGINNTATFDNAADNTSTSIPFPVENTTTANNGTTPKTNPATAQSTNAFINDHNDHNNNHDNDNGPTSTQTQTQTPPPNQPHTPLPPPTPPLIIGSLRKACYKDFVSYVRGAVTKLTSSSSSPISTTQTPPNTTPSTLPSPLPTATTTTTTTLLQQTMASTTLSTETIQAYENAFAARKQHLSLVWSLMAFSAGVVEALMVVDRWVWVREQMDMEGEGGGTAEGGTTGGGECWVEPVFSYGTSPRNLVIVAVKKK